MSAPSPPLPPFVRAISEAGELDLAWVPVAAARAHLVVALRDPDSFDAASFWSGAVDNDLIRVPVDAEAGRARAFVPAGRAVAVALVARDAAGAPLPAGALRLLPPAAPDAAADPRDSDESASPSPSSAQPDRSARPDRADRADRAKQGAGKGDRQPPPRSRPAFATADAELPLWRDRDGSLHTHPPGAASHAPTEFVFAGDDAPSLDALARRVAAAVATGRGADAHDADGPVAAALPRSSRAAGGFGARQRWYLTRLVLPPAEGPRRLVRRATFIDGDALARWRRTPPDDALEVPDDADGLVDALADADATTFYALLAAAPDSTDAAADHTRSWRSLPLSPAPPPFDRCARPLVLGEASARLAPEIDARLARLRDEPLALADLVPVLALVEAAVAFLPPDDGLRARTTAALAALASEPRF